VITALAADANYAFAGTEDGGLFRCRLDDLQGGQGWTELTRATSEITAVAVSELRPGEIYLGTESDGVIRSLNDGVTFQTYDKGLESSELEVFCLLISSQGDRLYAGTLGGLAVRQLE